MLSLLDILRRIEDGSLTPAAAIGRSLAAIAEGEAAIGAFAALDRAARAGDAGPLRGIAVGVKDIIDTADFPTGMGSPLYAGWRPKADAPVIVALKRLGATIIGKTTTTPFALSDPTATRNPRNPEHTPGGSSAGSAAAVAAGFVPLALGTQTAGSVIRPGAFCGVAAIKPSFDLLPTVGVKCSCWSLDTVGLFAAGAGDLASALALISGRPDLAIEEAPPAPRIGVVRQEFAGEPEPAALAALGKASRTLERAGAKVQDMTLPEPLAAAWQSHPVIQSFEMRQALAWEYAAARDALPPRLRQALDEAQGITAAAYDAAQAAAQRARAALAGVFERVDALMTLPAPGPAPRGLSSTGDPRFNRLWTLLGTPCVTVPVDRDGRGLPLGVQLVSAVGADARALAAARFLERALEG
jgi:Asp-tRNA(Asn)/Glu-tRNA(Gln) amidotransferase A subunit family amidase